MIVRFYTFNKRTNSTMRPSLNEPHTDLSCDLKAPTSILAPTIIVKNAPAQISTAWNYIFIAEFQRYYFIRNWTWLNGVWQVDGVVDVLATYKTDIGNMSEYVLRSASESNGQVIDLQYPTTAETRVNATDLSIGASNLPSFLTIYGMGYYVLGVISNDPSSSMGAVTYYQMSASQLADLKAYMMSDTFLNDQALDVQTVVDILPVELLKTLYDPFKYICSCTWMPFPIGDIPSSLKTSAAIAFGWWEPTDAGTNITGYRLNPNGYVKTYSERFPVYGHPQRFDRGVYLDHAPFADRMLYYPPYGSVPINDDSIIGGDFIRIEINVDMILGDSVLTVYHDRPIGQDTYNNMGVLARVSAPLGVSIQLAQTSVDVEGTVSAVALNFANNSIKTFEGSMGKYFGGDVGKVLQSGVDTLVAAPGNALSALGDAIGNPVGQLQTSGTNGSIAQYTVHPYFVQKWRIVADDDNTQKGRPLCQVKTLNTLSGFMMIDTPDISLSCMEPERQQIAAFMSGGFFFE